MASAPPGASASAPAILAPPPVPWTADTLRPLFAELVPVLETMRIDSLKSAAAKISPECVALVSSKAPWNPAAKTTLVTSGAQVGAKWLNRFGISADNAPEVAFGIAAASILVGDWILSRELAKLGAEAKAEREKAKKEESANVNRPNN